MNNIDLVIPTINYKDKVWRDTFLKYAMRHNPKQVASMNGVRFNDELDLFSYQIKLIEKNMPWIDRIFILLSNKEQMPSYLPKNAIVVYHSDFIPPKFLPTFNSTTIEMFLWNIKELGERFIYANDDMLPIKPLKISDFFTQKHIKINFLERDFSTSNTMYQYQCYNSYRHLLDRLNIQTLKNHYIYPLHSFTPMYKSHCKETFELLQQDILPKIRAFRTNEQHNQYIYPNYEHLVYGTLESKIRFLYTQLAEPNLIDLVKESDIICPNIVKDKKNALLLKGYLDELCK